ncbi:MAG: PEP-CTERM sorting domain-containing protein [Candidatus Acidiferrales bacterium]
MNSASRSKWLSRILVLAIFALVVLFVPGTAKADSQVTYNVSGSLGTAGTLSGSFTLDFGASSTTLVSSILNVGSDSFSCPGATGAFCTFYTGPIDGINIGSTGSYVQLLWSSTGFSSSTTGFSMSSGYLQFGGQRYALTGGSAAAVTPEPATWLLMLTGAGLLGFLGLRRRAVA